MATDSVKKVTDYKLGCIKEGEEIYCKVFPEKIILLNNLLEDSVFEQGRVDKIPVVINIPIPEPVLMNSGDEPSNKKRRIEAIPINDISGTKVLSLTNGLVPTNCHIIEMVNIVKPHIRDLIFLTNKLKMWITYQIPRIEDGNNFGVSIQEDTMAEARQVESEAATYLDQISRYFITRGKIISKVAKYPHVEDYRQTVKELDEKEFVSLRLVVIELRNHYCSLHDVISKNKDKIKKPRNSNTDNMY